ncbi:glutathione S-transferase N-terminal domain-containing protein [Stakelama saccharophila]|uniref:Glutathione S-transferase N-terminal domain-containing protein n=1 Tax=Stakelama saccharophila TaxID=3075605 RepID=A0ABZ0BCM8_9SPHN|nr:glutathione S-transferase N-terminal domain-containing protein [Stakelama sp. W311]WNO54947.1 glutathione S-transferase N-terminal domain-containing protein [Stakelama sp. W311]
MPDTTFRPRAWLLKTCPFCLKLRIALNEMGLDDRFDFTVFEKGDDTEADLRRRLTDAGIKPSYPAVEVAPGEYETESDRLIARYAREAGVDPETDLPLLAYYEAGVFPKFIELFKEHQARADADT